ncbi:MAG: tRNA threonylcarbamoyladenosine dehydratase [Alphaproteobacteria bacterium]|nr:tRNA threonylcarbamoyladenosine dehydratase [Alphaproteobacteria bacterium]
MDRLHRIRLLLGDAAVERLRGATVMVVGCGAVGSFAIEALARSGVGRLILVDFDRVEESNINRQLFALMSTLNQPKVDVAAARVRDINPDVRVDALNMFWDAASNPDVQPDFVIDAIDSVASKLALYQWCVAHNIAFISSMGAARKTDITRIRVSRISKTSVCPLAAKIRRMARDGGLPDFPVVFSDEVAATATPGAPMGSMITVTGAFGLHLANFAMMRIINS